MTFHPLRPKYVAPQALFDPEIFRSDIIKFGGDTPNIRWEKAFPCPCRMQVTLQSIDGEVGGEPRTGCSNCHNAGVYYVRQPDTYAIVTGVGEVNSSSGKSTGSGWAEVQATFTFLPENAPAHDDRVTDLRSWIQVSERRRRKRDVETFRFPLEVRDIVAADPGNPTVPTFHRQTVIELAAANADGSFKGRLEEGVDFEVIDGTLDWALGDALGTAPEVGSDYTVSYWAHPRYLIQNIPYISRPSVTSKPKQVGGVTTPALTDMPVKAVGFLEFVGPAAGTTGV